MPLKRTFLPTSLGYADSGGCGREENVRKGKERKGKIISIHEKSKRLKTITTST